ncbi:MAG: ABC transporter permease, partial [Actinomycetes bacterium]
TIALVVVVLAAAEAVARLGWVSRLVLPAPSRVAAVLWDGVADGSYWSATWATMGPTFAGFALSAAVAITMGAVLASVPRLEAVVMPLVFAIQSTPKIAIAPLIVLWLGFGVTGKITVVAVVSFFPILVNTLAGMRIQERDRVDLLRALGAGKMQLLRYIRLPNALPYIFAGLHVGIIFALIGAVVAEFVGSDSGLGYQLMQQKALFDVPGVFGSIVLLMVCGIVLDKLLAFLERRIVFWAADTSAVSV